MEPFIALGVGQWCVRVGLIESRPHQPYPQIRAAPAEARPASCPALRSCR
jgi:hypothetical protein